MHLIVYIDWTHLCFIVVDFPVFICNISYFDDHGTVRRARLHLAAWRTVMTNS